MTSSTGYLLGVDLIGALPHGAPVVVDPEDKVVRQTVNYTAEDLRIRRWMLSLQVVATMVSVGGLLIATAQLHRGQLR